MGRGKANGKIILFGEHFVVYDNPALACSIDKHVLVKVEEAEKHRVITAHDIIEELSSKAINNITGSMGIDKKYDIYLEGNLPTIGGLGSSAAFCVAFVRALSDENNISLSENEVNRHAYEGEKAFHGMPSGIDNYIATHGGSVVYDREKGFKNVEVEQPIHMVITSTGKHSRTAKMIERVKGFRDEHPQIFSQLMDEAGELVVEGETTLRKGKLEKLGKLMNENQRLLSEIGASMELDKRITDLALKAGALGSKITGGGGGGCCISLVRNEVAAKGVIMDLKRGGFESFYSKIGVQK